MRNRNYRWMALGMAVVLALSGCAGGSGKGAAGENTAGGAAGGNTANGAGGTAGGNTAGGTAGGDAAGGNAGGNTAGGAAGGTTGAGAVSAHETAAALTVNGIPADVTAYSLDDGSCYYKLEDMAALLDFGLTGEASGSGAAIDTAAHYKPDPKKLITGNWAPATRQRIQAVIDANADQGRYVCFDLDNTMVINDMGEALLVYQIENLRFALTPDNIADVITTNITDLKSPIGQTVDGKDVSTEDVVTDIVSDYTWLYENYKGFPAGGQYDLDYIHASAQYQDFAAKLFFLYYFGGHTYDASVVYPWVGHLFTGMTPDEVHALATDAHTYWSNYNRFVEESWTSPVNMPGKAGVVSITYRTGVVFLEEVVDLYQTLRANGIDIYVISGSFVDSIRAASDLFGYGLEDDHIFGMRNVLDSDGRYLNEYNYNWGGDGLYPQTHSEGKSIAITNFIAPAHGGQGPLMVFGDGNGDWDMMTGWMEKGDTVLGVLFNRYRSTNDRTWKGACEAVENIGKPDARFVLQGRDENKGCLRPSEKSILLGGTEEVLVRPAQ